MSPLLFLDIIRLSLSSLFQHDLSLVEKINTMRLQNKSKSKLDSCSSSESMFHPVVQSTSFGATGPSTTTQNMQTFRVFVATWNVGGKCPDRSLNLDHFLRIHDPSDIYVLGFQEIVPLNAGNVLVIEDNEPAVQWLALINQSLNRPSNVVSKSSKAILSGSIFFPKPSLKRISKVFRAESKRKLKACNCIPELERKNSRELCFRCQQPNTNGVDFSSDEEDDDPSNINIEISDISVANQRKYSLITCKQMVGIFLTIWMRTELVQHVSHLRVSYVSRGIMGCLGNKGCISVSMCFHQTSFCFICSHLASGEKEGDELRRNLDVIEILKNTQFKKICRTPRSNMPVKILDHDRVIWLGDLNYRIALSYAETKKFMEMNDWDTLLSKDQLKIERDAGRVFKGWKEGKIYFAPTYKYSYDSDAYAGETIKSRNKRRTPAWCDRVLWHGNGVHQRCYVRTEFRFSDHRPVCSEFLVDVLVSGIGSKRLISGPNMKVGAEEILVPLVNYRL